VIVGGVDGECAPSDVSVGENSLSRVDVIRVTCFAVMSYRNTSVCSVDDGEPTGVPARAEVNRMLLPSGMDDG
jgi:hypothetical protein